MKQFNRIMQSEHNHKWRNMDQSKEDQINSVQEKLDTILLSNKVKLDSNTRKVEGGKTYLDSGRPKFEVKLMKVLQAPLHPSRTEPLFKKKSSPLLMTISGMGLNSQKLNTKPQSLENSMEDLAFSGLTHKSKMELLSPQSSKPNIGVLLTEASSSSAAFRMRSFSPRSDDIRFHSPNFGSNIKPKTRKAIKLKLDNSATALSNLASVHQSSTMASVTSVSGSKQVTPQSQKPGMILPIKSQPDSKIGEYKHSHWETNKNSANQLQIQPSSKISKLLQTISSRATNKPHRHLEYHGNLGNLMQTGTDLDNSLSKASSPEQQHPETRRKLAVLPRLVGQTLIRQY